MWEIEAPGYNMSAVVFQESEGENSSKRELEERSEKTAVLAGKSSTSMSMSCCEDYKIDRF